MNQVRAQVSGRVQGVGYRYFVRDHATGMGIAGMVKNNPDGTVSVIAEGDESELCRFLSIIRASGDPVIEVTGMKVEWGEATHTFRGFEIRR